MTNYREILRLNSLQYSQRIIESMAHCSRHTVRDVLQAAKEQGISWPLPADVTNAELEQLLFPNKHKASSQYAEPDVYPPRTGSFRRDPVAAVGRILYEVP